MRIESWLFCIPILVMPPTLSHAEEPKTHPNVVLLFADDLGWGDLHVHGGATPTPHLDRLFHEGIELRTLLVTPLCSPTRAALMTGRHCARTGVAPFVINPDTGAHLRAEETTLAEAFKTADYATACLGKWHLGYSPTPNEQGFDLFCGCAGAAVDYFNRTRQRDDKLDWQLNGKPLEEKGYTTDLIRNRAVRYIHDRSRDGGRGTGDEDPRAATPSSLAPRPFFLYVPFTAVHNPQQASPEYLERVPAEIHGEALRTYAAMVIALDDAVGAILKEIEARGMAENTIVFFASDNGGTPTGNNKPFRSGKHSVYEGGLRSPSAIRWPGHLTGGRQTDAMMAIEDVYPTLLSLAKVIPPKGLPLDGHDFSPVLFKDAPSPREAQYWIWHDCDAIRTARWKMIRRWNTRELYDLQQDLAESKDLAATKPDLVAELEKKLDTWEASVPCYPSHVPVRLDPPARPAPEGDVLEFRAEHVSGAKGKPLSIILGRGDIILSPGDRLEYDMLIADDSVTKGFVIDTPGGPLGKMFDLTDAVDQYGTLQNIAAGFLRAEGHWARRVIGLANRSPRPMGIVRLTLAGKGPARYHFYMDNIFVRRADGQIVDIYRNGTRIKPRIDRSDEYKDVSVHATALTDVHSATGQ